MGHLRRFHATPQRNGLDLFYSCQDLYEAACINWILLIFVSKNSAPLSQTRGRRHKLFKRRCSTNVGTSFFVNRMTDVWKYSPENIADFNSLSAFKRTIKIIDFTTFLKCDWYFLDCTLLCNILLFYMCTCHLSFATFYRCIHIFYAVDCNVMHCTVNSALILWYQVSGGVILPCDYLKQVSSIVFMSPVYRTANMFSNIK